jgi:protein TonB
MFEQSIVLQSHPGRKAGALFASLAAQILAVGVLILVPLLYTEMLPLFRPAIPLTPPSLSRPEIHDPVRTRSASRSTSISLSPTRIFHPLPSAASSNFAQTMITDDALMSSGPVTNGGVPFSLNSGGPSQLVDARVKPAEPAVPVAAKPPRISLGAEPAIALKRVLPVYPELAKKMRISGRVCLIGVIATDGSIQELKVVSGHPLLAKATMDAVRQWVYRPTLLNGKPVEVSAPIDVIFTLSQ